MKKEVCTVGKRFLYGNCLVFALLLFGAIQAQTFIPDSSLSAQYRLVAPGRQYLLPSGQQKLWGEHYRLLWALPVRVPVVNLDTLAGGLTPYKAGGGNQSNTLHLRSAQGRAYVLRSVNKTYSRLLPPGLEQTIAEDIINDQVSTLHPYAALTIPPMARAAGIYHTGPQLYYVPQQAALDSFNSRFANQLYFFEEHPDDSWAGTGKLGNAKEIIGTKKLFEQLKQDNHQQVDQAAFARARLFDLFIGDWSRHEDQWRWAAQEKGNRVVYQPIPRDHDQAYTKFDGALLKPLLAFAGLSHLQSFDNTIKNIGTYNFPAHNLDRLLTNELSLQQWRSIAKSLQQSLTNEVIEQGVRQMPMEAFVLSGRELIQKLRARRNQLERWAADYYHLLAKNVDIAGSEGRELFVVTRLNKEETAVQIYALNENGLAEETPIYTRTFQASETKEVRLYSINGNDVFRVEGTAKNNIKIRLVGGPQQDSFVNQSAAGAVHIYDSRNNVVERKARLHLSGDTAVHSLPHEGLRMNKKGFSPIIFYGSDDRIFAGIRYKILRHAFRKEPFGQQHLFFLNYSLTQNAFHAGYNGRFQQVVGKWNLALNADYDRVRWTNFYGIGNESSMQTPEADFYRMRSRNFEGSVGLNRPLGKSHQVLIDGFYRTVHIINDQDRFLAKEASLHEPLLYKQHQFAGLRAGYIFNKLNNPVVPTKGISFGATASYTRNLTVPSKEVFTYSADVIGYLPLLKNLVWSSRTGAATVVGEPEFYQLASIGGSWTLRGHRRDRFWGKTAFYNSNELQWLFDFKNYWYSGKIGLVALFDQGRVWQPGERSNKWHTSFGGGIVAAPLNRIMASVTYAISPEQGRLHVRIIRQLSF